VHDLGVSASRPSTRTVLLLVGTWLLGAAVAIGVGFFAIQRVGNDLNLRSADPMSDTELRQAAAMATAPPETGQPSDKATAPPETAPSSETPNPATSTTQTSPAGPPPPSTGPAGQQSRRFTTDGGVVAASCSNTTITLLYAYPNNGYTSQVSRDPRSIEVEFHSPARDVHLHLSCAGGKPTQDDPESPERETEHR
jgi:hypothetical protein